MTTMYGRVCWLDEHTRPVPMCIEQHPQQVEVAGAAEGHLGRRGRGHKVPRLSQEELRNIARWGRALPPAPGRGAWAESSSATESDAESDGGRVGEAEARKVAGSAELAPAAGAVAGAGTALRKRAASAGGAALFQRELAADEDLDGCAAFDLWGIIRNSAEVLGQQRKRRRRAVA